MTTQSSILAWRISWTEEPGRLQSMGSQRIGHNRATNAFTCAHTCPPKCWLLTFILQVLGQRCLILWINLDQLWMVTYISQIRSRAKHCLKQLVSRTVIQICSGCREKRASLATQSVKNPPAMQEIQVLLLCWEDPLEKEMATHSSILAWRIPRKEEPGRRQSMGSQRVRHD